MAVFAIMAGLLCATSYAKSLKDALGSTKLGEKLQQNEKLNKASSQKTGGNVLSGRAVDTLESEWRNQRSDYLSAGEWEGIDFNSDGTCDCWNGGAKGLDGKWTGGLKKGDKLTVTAGSTTYSGTVTAKGNSLEVTLGKWGTFRKVDEK